MEEAVARVLGRLNITERYNIKLPLKFLLIEYRLEEWRNVNFNWLLIAITLNQFFQLLWHALYKASCYMFAQQLFAQMMQQMCSPDDVDEEVYISSI